MEKQINELKSEIGPVPKGFFKRNRDRLLAMLANSPNFDTNGIIFLSGPRELAKYNDDATEATLPEPFFYYLFGITEDLETYGIIDIKTCVATIFTKFPDPSESIWIKGKSLEEFKQLYEIDDAQSLDQLEKFLEKLGNPGNYTIYLNEGLNPANNHPTATPYLEFKKILDLHRVDRKSLYVFGRECRLFKSKEEIQIMRDAIKIASFAHLAVMKLPCEGMTERQLSDYFTSIVYAFNTEIPYPNIFCAGENGSYLHYQPSNDVIFKKGQLVLNDSASKLFGYNSDITRTFPVNGRFSEKQKAIYNIVLDAQLRAIEKTRPGVLWVETQDAAFNVIIEGLLKLGLLKGDIKDLIEKKIVRTFMPHGLGHYIGLYVHDTPGKEFLTPDKLNRSSLWSINRFLAKGMVLTIEPGIYFNEALLSNAYKDENTKNYLVPEVIEAYKKEVGGIRIEDMFLITENSNENLSADLIKTAEEIEAYMR